MYKVLVFAGTTEGYEICRFLADHKIETKGFVATEYGSKSLTENEFLTVQTGRLDAAAMGGPHTEWRRGCSGHGRGLFTGETGNGAGCHSSLCC